MKYILFTLLVLLSCSKSNNNSRNEDSRNRDFTEVVYNTNKPLTKFPISKLIKSINIIQLDNQNEALTEPGVVNISPHYIGVRPRFSDQPYKLFDNKGNFLCNVGAKGQGPGEYVDIYNTLISEKDKCVYIIPYNATKILAYDFKGKYLEKKSIPLPYLMPKCVAYVNPDINQVIVIGLSFNNTDKPSLWIQDFRGNIIKSISSDRYQITPDYSADIFSYNTTKNIYSVHFSEITKKEQYTLYYYNIDKNELIPRFSIKDPTYKEHYKLPVLIDLPSYFCADMQTIQKRAQKGTNVADELHILVNKKTKEEQYCHFTNDYIGNIEINIQNSALWFSNGYLTMIFDPGALMDMLEERKQEPDVTKADLKAIEEMMSKLAENSNCIVMYGKLKQE